MKLQYRDRKAKPRDYVLHIRVSTKIKQRITDFLTEANKKIDQENKELIASWASDEPMPPWFERKQKPRLTQSWIVGNALEFYIPLLPLLHEIYELTEELKGPEFVKMVLLENLEQTKNDILNALGEMEDLV